MQFDDVLRNHVGEFGRYQKLLVAALQLATILASVNLLEQFFTGVNPGFWPAGTNSTDNITDPCVCSSAVSNGTSTTESCTAWEYDDSVLKSTIVTEFDLVCGRAWLAAAAPSVYFGGTLAIFILGALADRFGRRPIFLASLVLNAITRLVSAFSPNITVYILMRFILGMCTTGMYTAIFILVTELVGPNYRLFVGTTILLVWCVGYMVCVLIVYFIRVRYILELVLTVPFLFGIVYYWLCPESPRWLYARGRTEEADKLMQRIAKGNGTYFPEGTEIDAMNEDEPKVKETEDGRKLSGVHQLFTSRTLVLRMSIMTLNWFAVSLLYFGLTMNSVNLAGDMFLNTFLSGLVEIPAYIAVYFVLSSAAGRVVSISASLVAGGLFVMATAPLEIGITATALGLVGKAFVSFAYGAIYIFTAEVFPTVVRTLATSMGTVGACVGAIIAPFLVAEAKNHASVIAMIYGCLAIIAGLLLLFLPETKGQRLPQDVEDAEEMNGFILEKCKRKRRKDIYSKPTESRNVNT